MRRLIKTFGALGKMSRRWPWSKYNLRRIKGITQSDVDQFSKAGLADQQLLQENLDSSVGSVFQDLESRTQILNSRLLALLQDSLNLWSRPSLFHRVKQHGADIVFMAMMGLLVLDFSYPAKKQVRIIAARQIQVLHRIQMEDLREDFSPGQKGERTDQFIGKYTISSVQPGTSLSSLELSPGLTSMRIEIKSSAMPDGATLPQDVTLVFSSRNSLPSGATFPAILLRIDVSQDRQIATLQIASVDEISVAKWVGSADAFITLRSL